MQRKDRFRLVFQRVISRTKGKIKTGITKTP